MKKKKNRIVVMGGSFNPPTTAHYKLMKEAVDALEADIGFFVPVSDAYLKRKMRHSHPPVVLSPEMRVRMLRSMCSDDSRLQVCEKEIGTIEPRTMPTLQALQEDFPNAELYFVMGADKFDLLASLTKKREFLDAFKVVLFSREDETLEQTLKSNEVLAHYLEKIVILPQPEGTAGVSSSVVRERMLLGESCRDMLCPGVWELFKDPGPPVLAAGSKARPSFSIDTRKPPFSPFPQVIRTFAALPWRTAFVTASCTTAITSPFTSVGMLPESGSRRCSIATARDAEMRRA